jgi:hypothetical protein
LAVKRDFPSLRPEVREWTLKFKDSYKSVDEDTNKQFNAFIQRLKVLVSFYIS